MKKLLGLGILGLLLSGCKQVNNDSREHQIVCWDTSEKHQTFNIITPGNINAFVVKGHSVLAYRDNENKVQIILLKQNDCAIY